MVKSLFHRLKYLLNINLISQNEKSFMVLYYVWTRAKISRKIKWTVAQLNDLRKQCFSPGVLKGKAFQHGVLNKNLLRIK